MSFHKNFMILYNVSKKYSSLNTNVINNHRSESFQITNYPVYVVQGKVRLESILEPCCLSDY